MHNNETHFKYEEVDHPPHYNSHPSGVECIDIIEHLPYNIGAAMKYLWRAGLKPGVENETDLKKATWYINREIQRLKKERGNLSMDRRSIFSNGLPRK